MKKMIILAALLLMVVVGCTESKNAQKVEAKMKNQDKIEIEALLIAYKAVLNNSDAEGAVRLYASDGIFMPSGAPSAKGSVEVLGAYKFVFSQIQLSIEFFIDEIVVEGDMAYAVTSSKGTTLVHATGETIPEENRELFVFAREKKVWKIGRYMFNKMK